MPKISPIHGSRVFSNKDSELRSNEIVEIARKLMADNDNIGSILLECIDLSSHAVGVQNAVRMPEWDYTTLANRVYSGSVRRRFTGFIYND